MAITGVKDSTSTYATAMNNESSQISGPNKLSDTAKSYLNNEVQKKIPEANITVVDFKSKEQKLNYMLGCSGTKNVAISSNIVEQMAANPEVAAKYEKIISENVPLMTKYAKICEEETNCIMLGTGMVIDKNGKVSYWGVSASKEIGETLGTKYRKEMQKQLTERQAEKKAEEKKAEKKVEEKKKNVTIAESVLELQEKIMNNMKAAQEKPIGDFDGKEKNGKVDVFI